MESAFMDAASSDLGWEQEEDWKVKRYILEKLDSRNKTKLRRTSPEFRSLNDDDSLRNLFCDNVQFHLISGTSFIEKFDKLVPCQSSNIHQWNHLAFDSMKPISKSVTELFNTSVNSGNDDGIQRTSLHPKFLRIHYTVLEGYSREISAVRVLRFEAPEALRGKDGQWELGIQSAVYNLCAVVRITTGQKEYIRIYAKDGSEVLPAEVGNYRLKEPEAHLETQWSISEPGEYVLFYYREWTSDRESEMELESPEYRERQWVIRDRDEATE
jgi:hypothetical protein